MKKKVFFSLFFFAVFFFGFVFGLTKSPWRVIEGDETRAAFSDNQGEISDSVSISSLEPDSAALEIVYLDSESLGEGAVADSSFALTESAHEEPDTQEQTPPLEPDIPAVVEVVPETSSAELLIPDTSSSVIEIIVDDTLERF